MQGNSVFATIFLAFLSFQLRFCYKLAKIDFLSGKPQITSEGIKLESIIDDMISLKFENWTSNNEYISYQDWNKLRKEYGVKCRDHSDCNWIDENLHCYEPVYMNSEPNVSIFS